MANTDHVLLPQLQEPCVALHHYSCTEPCASAPLLALSYGQLAFGRLFVSCSDYLLCAFWHCQLSCSRTGASVCFLEKATK